MRMKPYKIYFEIYGKKLVTEYYAYSYEEAKQKFIDEFMDKLIVYDNVREVSENDSQTDYNPFEGDVFNNLMNIVNGYK